MKYLRKTCDGNAVTYAALWWRPNKSGYTGTITSAGLYEHADEYDRSDHSTQIPALPAIEAEIAKVREAIREAVDLASAKIAELDKMRALCVESGQ